MFIEVLKAPKTFVRDNTAVTFSAGLALYEVSECGRCGADTTKAVWHVCVASE